MLFLNEFRTKSRIDSNVRIVVTKYHTASRRLGNIFEFTHEVLVNKYRRFINEIHLLLQHPVIIEMISEFNFVGLCMTTQRELKHLFVFQ